MVPTTLPEPTALRQATGRTPLVLGLLMVTSVYLASFFLPAVEMERRSLDGWEAATAPMEYLLPSRERYHKELGRLLLLSLATGPGFGVAVVLFLRGRWFAAGRCGAAGSIAVGLWGVQTGYDRLGLGYWLGFASLVLLTGLSVLGGVRRGPPLVGKSLSQRSLTFVDFVLWIDLAALAAAVCCSLGRAVNKDRALAENALVILVRNMTDLVGWPITGTVLGGLVGLVVGSFSNRALAWGALGAVFGGVGITAAVYFPGVKGDGYDPLAPSLFVALTLGAGAGAVVYVLRRFGGENEPVDEIDVEDTLPLRDESDGT